MPSKFIEVTSKDDKKELLNTNVIEKVHVSRGKTVLRLREDTSLGTTTLEIKEDYEAVKRQLLGGK